MRAWSRLGREGRGRAYDSTPASRHPHKYFPTSGLFWARVSNFFAGVKLGTRGSPFIVCVEEGKGKRVARRGEGREGMERS